MRPLGIVIAFVGLASVSAATIALRDRVAMPGHEAAQDVASLPQTAGEASTAPAAPSTAAPHQLRIRPVAPEIVAPPPLETETLERVDAREPLSPIGRAPSRADLPPAETMLHRPVANAAGMFEARGYQVALAGIVVTDANEMCDSDGIPWPCGIHARTAFRNWLRGRAPTCVVPSMPPEETIVADCRIGEQNPAEWLVAQGWARAVADGAYAALEAKAREQGRGLFGPAPALPGAATVTAPDASGG